VVRDSGISRHDAAVAACFFLSGVAALVYQTAWTRQFALVFGTSELAVATVLAAYMAGLALGAWLIERWLPRLVRPVRTYAALELGIALAAVLLVPACLGLAERVLLAMFGGQAELPVAAAGGTTLFYLLAAFLTLLVPTTLMGATLPILARDGVQRDADIGARIGALYAINTAGAVLGALLTAVVLLPRLGLRASEWVAAGLNLVVCLIAGLGIRERPSLDALRSGAATETSTPAAPGPAASGSAAFGPATRGSAAAWILPLMLLSGAVTFTHEVLWTRLLQRIVGGSVLAFGVMVASFLLGIALGGALGSRLARDRGRAVGAWIAAELAAALAALGGWYLLSAWNGDAADFTTRALFGLGALLPLSTALGLTYPLAVRILATGVADAPSASARVYAWNTLGAIAGALVAGFVLIPALRYEGALAAAVAASALLAAAAAWLGRPTAWRWMLGAGAALAVVAVALRPAVPTELLHRSPVRITRGPLLYYGVGRSADVVVVREARALGILSNGLPEAAVPLRGDIVSAGAEAWMAAVAVLARPELQTLLVVGLGGGNVVNGVPPAVRSIDIIELEPEIVRANRALASLRDRDPLADTRVHLVVNDARAALALSARRYDAILSQPSHPWTAGASHLYTREFLEQAHAHLAAGGVFVQWMNAAFLDERLLRSMMATWHMVFPEVRVYRTSPTDLVFLASDARIDPERHPQALRATLERSELHYARLGLAVPEDLLAVLALDNEGVARLGEGSEPITDDDNRLATAGVQERHGGLGAARLDELLAPFDPLVSADGFAPREIRSELSFDYLWRGMALDAGESAGGAARAGRLAEALGDTEEGAYLRYLQALQAGHAAEAQEQLAAGLVRWPASAVFRYAVVDAQLARISAGEMPPELGAAMARLPAEPAMVVRTLRAAAAEDWGAVARADEALAAVRWTAPWGLQAAQLRAEWRARVASPELRHRYGDEGIRLCDRALAAQPTLIWYALRALNGASADRPDVVLESAVGFAANARDAWHRLDAPGQVLVRAQARTVAGLLFDLERAPDADGTRVDRARLAEVRVMLRDALGDDT
jgi:spermidine synthase